MSLKLKIFIFIGVAGLVAAITLSYFAKDKVLYKPVPFALLNNWENQDFTDLKETFIKNCAQQKRYYNRLKLDEQFGTKDQWQGFCSGLSNLTNDEQEIKEYFEKLTVLKMYQPFKSESLFTGYYAPVLEGSYVKSEEYNYPIYKRPVDLVEANLKDFFSDKKYRFRKIFARVENGKIKPYYTRQEIDDAGVLTDENVIVWVNDKVAAFFLHIQGSGQVKIQETGEMIHVGYAGQNGHAYNAIGGYMAAQGMIERDKISLQTIREYLVANPDKVDDILNKNPSYIFFIKKKDGPYGAFNIILTDNHSVAVDRRFIPLGTPLFVETKVSATGQDYNKMMFAQDIGGAIKGAIRADIFFGSDDTAEEYSGKQNQEGRMYVFSAKDL